MQKIDVAIQSYKKPESLIYTLFSLKKACGNLIDTVYINDDCSGDDVVAHYLDPKLQEAILPIKLRVRANTKPGGIGKTLFTKTYKPNTLKMFSRWIRAILKKDFYEENDIRYQWAINATDKKYLFIIHDDIKFFDNILEVYLKTIEQSKNLAIVGDLGICNVCLHQNCTPTKIMQGYRPSKYYPLTISKNGPLPLFYRRGCRISEWCCLVNSSIAKDISQKYSCYFGNYEDKGDIAAYWFWKIQKLGYDFADPITEPKERIKYYLHGWQGHSGNSVWNNEGVGRVAYQKKMIVECLKNEFDYDLT